MLVLFYFYLIPLTVINKDHKGSLQEDLLVLGIKQVFWRWPVREKNGGKEFLAMTDKITTVVLIPDDFECSFKDFKKNSIFKFFFCKCVLAIVSCVNCFTC